VGKGLKAYAVTVEQVASWREAFPGVDVPQEIRKAKAWLEANPTRRKTHKGTPTFLVGWFGRTQDRGGNGIARPSSTDVKPRRLVVGVDEATGEPIFASEVTP
jgi:hypothetical protein